MNRIRPGVNRIGPGVLSSGRRRPVPRRLLGEAGLASLVAGVVVGVLWPRLAPDVTLIVIDGAARLGEQAGLHVFDQDAWFGILAVVAGVLLGGALWHRHGERHPVATPIVLVAGGLAGSVLAWQVGGRLGPQLPSTAGLEDLTEVTAPLELHAYGVLLLWPLASVVVVLLGALLTPEPSGATFDEAVPDQPQTHQPALDRAASDDLPAPGTPASPS